MALHLGREPAAVLPLLRRWLAKLWASRGGGFYGLGYVVTFVALEIKSLAGGLTTVDGLVAQAVQYVPSRRRGYPKSEKPWPTKNAASRKSARENDHSVPAAAPDAGKPRRSSCVADYAACVARLFCGRGLRTLRFR